MSISVISVVDPVPEYVSGREAMESQVIEGYRSGTLDLTKLISHRFPVSEAEKAIRVASNPQPDSMKVVIKL